MRIATLAPLALLLFATAGCCGSYLRVRYEVRREVGSLELPPPEIVVSKSFSKKMPDLTKVSIFFLQTDRGNSRGREFVDLPEIRELERSFVRGGFEVLEVRQISKVQLEKGLEKKSSEGAGSDFIVIVYNITPRNADLATVRATGDVFFEYGCDLGTLWPTEASAIDAKVGVQGAMRPIFDEASRQRDQQISETSSELPIASLEAKLIETETREVLFFYKAHTLLEAERPAGEEVKSQEVGVYQFRDGRFQPYDANKGKGGAGADPYGSTVASRTHEGGRGLSEEDLARVRIACDGLVAAIKQGK